MRKIRPPTRPPLCKPYIIQYRQQQYRVKAKLYRTQRTVSTPCSSVSVDARRGNNPIPLPPGLEAYLVSALAVVRRPLRVRQC